MTAQWLKHRLLAYCDANRRAMRETDSGWTAAIRAIYVSRYRQRQHGRRDERPQHWRQYLNKDRS